MSGSALHSSAPDFTLTDQFGRSVSLHQFRGKVVLLAFVDSECTTICPLTTQSMLESLNLVGRSASWVQLLGVDANPRATSVADVRAYSVEHGLMRYWHFLTGPIDELKAVWAAYHILAQVVQGQVDHTPALYVIDPRGRERWVYLTPMEYAAVGQEAEILASDVSRLLPSHPRVLPPPAVRPQVTSLAQPIWLPVLAGNAPRVELGADKTRLVVFYASWVPDAQDNLRALNQYAVDAARSGLPPLVAVDVATTEPSAATAAQFVNQVGFLLYPVAKDTDGQVADLYLVQDLPWLALVNRSGHVVWWHDGWVSVPQLEGTVGNALRA